MFVRSLSTANVYHKNLHQLFRRTIYWNNLKSSVHRCQNRGRHSAVAVKDEDDENYPIESPAKVDSQAQVRPKKGSHAYRHFRPHNAADLGVESLGKPAEVLILPSRDRKSPLAQHDDNHLEPNDTHKTLSAVVEPASWQNVQQNIDTVRKEIVQDNTDLGIEQYDRLRKTLAAGFTKRQLVEYLRQHATSEPDESKYSSQSKAVVAQVIIDKIWNLNLNECDPEESERSTDALLTRKIQTSRSLLDLALLGPNEHFKSISDQYGVQIHLFVEQGNLTIHGSRQAVLAASSHVKRYLKEFISGTLPISPTLQYLIRNARVRDDFFSMLKHKHSAIISRKQDELHVTSRDEFSQHCISRDLLLFSQLSKSSCPPSLRFPTRAKTVQVPMYPQDVQDWFSERLSWRRTVARDDKSNTEVPSSAGLLERTRTILAGMAKEKDIVGSRSASYAIEPRAVRYKFEASFGQILVNDTGTLNPSPTHGDKIATRSMLIAEYPYLNQLLASRQVTPRSVTIINLRFRPSDDTKMLPTFEVVMQGDSAELGMRQPLRMLKVSAVLSERTHDVLLPSQPVDIRLTRKSVFDIFSATQGKPDDRHLPLLKALASAVETARDDRDGAMEPLWKFNLLSLIKTAPAPVADASPTTPEETTEPYFLEPAEVLNVDSYEPSSLNKFPLDHVFADAGPSDIPRHREMLRMAESSLSSLLTSTEDTVAAKEKANTKPRMIGNNEKRLGEFLDAAIKFANSFGANARAAGSNGN